MTDNAWVAYSLTGGIATKLLRGSQSECSDFVRCTPVGPDGGSTHIAYRPLKKGRR